ncbi:unnamed protein product [Lactuca saligna]|nr:unnamed protein product [Lactuca saligna]
MSGALLEAYDELHRCCFLSTSRDAEETKENIVNLKRKLRIGIQRFDCKDQAKKMALDNSYNSWADQWDPEPEYYNGYPGSKSNHGSGNIIKSKVGEGFDKSKTVATTGMKKVKNGTTLGFRWIKDKYHKTTHK